MTRLKDGDLDMKIAKRYFGVNIIREFIRMSMRMMIISQYLEALLSANLKRREEV